MSNIEYLGEWGLILLLLVLLVIFIPLSFGMIIAYGIGVVGLNYYLTVLVVSTLIWIMIFAYYYN